MGAPRRMLNRFDAVAIIVSIVIGAGIFSIPGIVAGHLADPVLILAAWIAGGAIALLGALCYAELASTYPSSGGEYRFLTRAYGPNVGFMFAWARMTVMQTGSIAVLAFVFGDFASRILDLGAHSSAVYGASAIILATIINLAGVRETKFVQGVLFTLTMLGVLGVIAAGFIPAAEPVAAPGPAEADGDLLSAIGLAMIYVFFTFGGWNEAAYISGEIEGSRRNIAWALVVSIGLITAVYLALNLAYLNALGPQAMAGSETIASDVLETAVGDAAAVAMSVLVMIVVLASLNVTIFTGARTNYAVGEDFSLFGFLARWSSNGGAPVPALILQTSIALGLVLLGTLNRGGLETAIEYLAPVFWFFLLLTILAIFVLRKREPNIDRPFRTPLYPITPVLFCLVSGYLLYSSLNYTGIGALAGVAILAAGIPILLWAKRTQAVRVGGIAAQIPLSTTTIKEKYKP